MNSYPSIKQAFGILGVFLIATLLCGVISLSIKGVVSDEAGFLITYVLSVGGTFFISHTIRKSKTSLSEFNLVIEDPKILVYLGLVGVAIAFGVTGPLTSLIPMNDFVKDLVLQIAQYDGVWGFLAIVIAAPVLEELIFRGIILDGFLKRYSPVKSILVSSALFGIFHMNPWQFITAMLLGSFIGWVYYRTRSVGSAIFIHMINNFAAFASMQFTEITVENIDQPIIEYYGGILPFLAITLSSLVIIVCGLYVLNAKMRKAPDFVPEPSIQNVEPTINQTTP